MKPYSNPNEKIPEGLMEIFSNFWSGFLNDYRNNKTLFNIAFAANKTWEKTQGLICQGTLIYSSRML